ncbi:UDP-3-O-acylglucosamine N-acyltransferase-like [Heracleum sosnowskyi]|uniref:non-specific serine/threonine protein kinase n=1 Tax=Heracleum sosnowskyi TaxID=360622 RepID=A0AAD8HZ86_9APIA|nr:UDP-3-O-acylglucosamine N-acyltransferase-like [Heracleum sosnowskyi]
MIPRGKVQIIPVSAFFIFIHIIFIPGFAEPYLKICSPTTENYTLNSPYEKNLNTLLDRFALRISKDGYFNSSVGSSGDVVYGQALCRGDVTRKACQDCVANASREVKQCPGREAFLWYENCQVQYSYSLDFSQTYAEKFPNSNDHENPVVVHPNQYKGQLKQLMTKLAKETYGSKSMFATRKTKFEGTTIYALSQCLRDITTSSCETCLNKALEELYGCCGVLQGGTVFGRSCNVRFSVNKFYRETTRGSVKKMWMVVTITSGSTVAILVLVGCFYFLRFRKTENNTDDDSSQNVFLHSLGASARFVITEESNIVSGQDLPFIALAIVKAATENFSDYHKLGQGGFGTVYKGVLPNGMNIAVKRLSRKSWQGIEEFKNEIILIAKLQHRNLVRLLSCSIEGDEKLLIYEYMPNKSLDRFIYDAGKRSQLGWNKRLDIIHDFGMARIFGEDEITGNTKRIVGTYGYMAPEYAMGGQFSVKSDVFSFGVILLEIISGKRNSGFYRTEHAQTLTAYAWQLWKEGRELDIADTLVTETCPVSEVARCIHIGLLCVQEDPEDRPTMSSVVVLFRSEAIILPQPGQPAFSVSRNAFEIAESSTTDLSSSQLTDSVLYPR